MHKHLRRLQRVWIDWPIYFVTTCTFKRRAILTSRDVAAILLDEWHNAQNRQRWVIGRYAIVPDHVHFFCRAELGAKALPRFIRLWKQWTSKRMARQLRLPPRFRQEGFFDHVLRSSGSYAEKWNYVRENPVRAGLIKNFDAWQWRGAIQSLML